jgi:hypothetical protein
MACASTAPAAAQPVAKPGFTLSVFATAPTGLSAPDSLVATPRSVWIGYGNGVPPDGSSGSSNIVEYSPTGKVRRNLTVAGHNDGLRLDPETGLLWALQNEDANPKLVIIHRATGVQSTPLSLKPVNGGGYDDVAFTNGRAYVSASNPALNGGGINTHPALVLFRPDASGGFTPINVLKRDAFAFNVVTRQHTQLNLTDPDSLTVTPSGDVLMDSQADGVLILVHTTQKAGHFATEIPLQGGAQVDDTAFATTAAGTLFVADRNANTVYAISSAKFAVGEPYSAGNIGTNGFVSRVSLTTGVLTPIVTGLVSPHGMVFRPATP